ncbi:MAG: FHA domain-containing protein, partial [Myxococcota bacterium]
MALKITVKTTSDSIAAYEFVFDRPEITVGRSASCDVQLPFPTVSSRHLTLLREGSTYLVADIGSTNGTSLNDRLLEANHFTPITFGDKLVLTDVTLTISSTDSFNGDMTSDQTADLVRNMVSDYLEGQSLDPRDTTARLEVLQGPDVGTQRALLKEGGRMAIGTDPSVCHWVMRDPEMPPHAFSIEPHRGTWALEHGGHTMEVYLDGYPIATDGPVRIRGGGRVRVGHTTLLFIDPLEDVLADLEDISDDEGMERPPTRSTVEVPDEHIQAVRNIAQRARDRTPSVLMEGELPSDDALGQLPEETTQQVYEDDVNPEPPRTQIGLPLSSVLPDR